jgi:hypothetical protein
MKFDLLINAQSFLTGFCLAFDLNQLTYGFVTAFHKLGMSKAHPPICAFNVRAFYNLGYTRCVKNGKMVKIKSKKW